MRFRRGTETGASVARAATEALERRRYRAILTWTIVAAVAGAIAAFASVAALLRPLP